MDFIKISIKRPVTTIVAILIVLMFGMVSLTKIPVDLYPSMEIPKIIINTKYDGVGSNEIENLITKPIEQAVATVSNVESVSSLSSQGISRVTLSFVDGTNMDFAALDVREKVDLVKGRLPEEASDPRIMAVDPNSTPIINIGVTSNHELEELMEILEGEVISKIERIEGVGAVEISGDSKREVSVTLIPEKLSGYGLDSSTVVKMLQAENLNLPIGDITYGSKDMAIRVIGKFNTISDVENVLIPTPAGSLRLSDIAVVEEAYKDKSSYSYINGVQSINLAIKKQSIANTVEVAKLIRVELDKLERDHEDLNFILLYDSAESIEKSIGSVADAALIGMLLAGIIIFIFLKNIRNTLIVGITMPLAIVFTFLFMLVLDISINIISLGGLTLGVGMLVDSSIVVLENINRHRKEGLSKAESAYKGAKEVSLAVVASTLTTMAVFIPMVFTEGIIKIMFTDLSLTVVASLLASLIVSLTIVPMMCSKLMTKGITQYKLKFIDSILKSWEGLIRGVNKVYVKLLRISMKKRKTINAIMILIFVSSLILLKFIGFDFMPTLDEGSINISISLPKGTRIEETFDITNEIVDIVDNIEEEKVIFYTVRPGSSSISIDVSDDKNRRPTEYIMEEIRQITSNVPGARISIKANSLGVSSMGGKPIKLQIIGDDLDTLSVISDDISKIMSEIEGIRGVTSSSEDGIPETQITIDREKASLFGLTLPDISKELQGYVRGSVATQLEMDGTEIDLSVVFDEEYVATIEDIKSLVITTPLGNSVTLDEIAEIENSIGPIAINREDGKRIVTVESDLFEISTGEATQLIKKELKDYPLPSGYSFSFKGETEQMSESYSSLGLALAMAILLVYFILAAQFESFLNPFIIMFSVPYAISGALFGLFISNKTMDMTAMMGIIMLAGIVVNNAIVLITYIMQLRDEGLTKEEAILKAGPTRLQPILMTTLTTVLAMVPVAVELGEGTKMISPLAVAVIGGLLFSTFITLIIVPVNYLIFENFRNKIRLRMAKRRRLKIED